MPKIKPNQYWIPSKLVVKTNNPHFTKDVPRNPVSDKAIIAVNEFDLLVRRLKGQRHV